MYLNSSGLGGLAVKRLIPKYDIAVSVRIKLARNLVMGWGANQGRPEDANLENGYTY